MNTVGADYTSISLLQNPSLLPIYAVGKRLGLHHESFSPCSRTEIKLRTLSVHEFRARVLDSNYLRNMHVSPQPSSQRHRQDYSVALKCMGERVSVVVPTEGHYPPAGARRGQTAEYET